MSLAQNNVLMKKFALVACLLVAGFVGGCSKSDSPAASSKTAIEQADLTVPQPGALNTTPAMDACKLLSNEEIASIQGEAPARTQLVGQSDGRLAVSQCNFLLPTGTSSLSLRVVERSAGGEARDPKQVWRETFRRKGQTVRDPRDATPLTKVDDVGEEAFWVGNAESGGLHVLKGNRYIRLSAGGEEDVQTKITKCSKLAEFVLPRLAQDK